MFIFKKLRDLENPFDVSEVEMKVESASLTEILEEFKFFLMSSGFHITGDIEIIEDEPEYIEIIEDEPEYSAEEL